MKKKILTLAFVAASVFSFSALAQKPATCTPDQCAAPVTCDANTACARPDNRPCPFDGLNLTDAQKTQLKDLRAKKDQKKRDDRQKSREDRMTAQKQYLQDVKSILTPEQYVAFLENYYITAHNRPNNKGNFANAKKFDKAKHHGKDLRHDKTSRREASPSSQASK